MTFSILAKDPNSKEIGIAIATYSLAVGATCPFYVKGKAVITSQSSTNPKIGQKIKQLIENKKKRWYLTKAGCKRLAVEMPESNQEIQDFLEGEGKSIS